MIRRHYNNAQLGETARRSRDEIYCPEIELMKSVLACQLKDYLDGIRITGDSNKALEVRGRARTAKAWIEDRGKYSTSYVFGFEFICKIIDLDPGRLRKKLLLIKTEKDANEIKKRDFVI